MVTPIFAPDVGGVETMLKNLCAYLSQRRFQVDVVTYSPLIVRTKAPLKERLDEYVTVRRIPWIGFGLFNIFERYPPIQFFYLVPGLLLGTLLFLLRKDRRPDIIHAFGLSGAFAGGLVSRIFGIPCVVDMCTVYRLSERRMLAWFVRLLLNWSDYVRGNNPAGKQELVNIGISPDKVGMIAPPVDESVFKPIPQTEARTRTGLPKKGYIALFVGRMVDSKGVDTAVAATRLVRHRDVTFVFVGEGPLRHLVEEAAASDKRIRIVGNVRHHDLVYYYNAADILMCAPVDSELIAFVGREALMCGLPILAPNAAVYFGIPYPVNPRLISSQIGRLLDPTPAALTTALNGLIEMHKNTGTSPFNRQACRKHALKYYSYRSQESLIEDYEKAIRIRHESKRPDRCSMD